MFDFIQEFLWDLNFHSFPFTKVVVSYNYEDGEEGDTWEYNYFYNDVLMVTEKNNGGDWLEYEWTKEGKSYVLDLLIKTIKEQE